MAAQPPTSQPQSAPTDSPTGAIAALGAGELLPATAVELAAPVVPVAGAKLTAAAAKVLAALLASFEAFEAAAQKQSAVRLRQTLTTLYPERTPQEIARLVRDEMVWGQEVARKRRERIQRDFPGALAITDPQKRQDAVAAILAREKRYQQMREAAMNDRAAAAAEYLGVKEDSPEGGYWKLSDHVKEHTPACVLPGELVSGPQATHAFARPYSGEAVEVVVASGQKMSVTPNHPVLTTHGWVNAGALCEGDHVLRSLWRDGDCVGMPDHDFEPESRIEDVFHAIKESISSASTLRSVDALDFHGDGIPDTQVDVAVTYYGLLLDGLAELLDPSSEFVLEAADEVRRVREPDGLATATVACPRHASLARVETAQGDSSRGALRVTDPGLGESNGLAVATDRDATTDEEALDRWPGDPFTYRELLDRLAGLVVPDEIVSIRRFPYSGHVYNLSTVENWYAVNGIVTHNCVAFGNKFWPHDVLQHYRPRIHGGCACQLLTKQQAVEQGFIGPDHTVDVRDAVLRARQIARTYDEMSHYHVAEAALIERAREVLDEPLGESLQETGYGLRWAAGTAHGGEFRPRVGGDPGDRLRRLVRELVPHRPLPPTSTAALGLGRWQSVNGRDVFVPEGRTWERRLGGKLFRSPVGSTLVHEIPGKPKDVLPADRAADVRLAGEKVADDNLRSASAVVQRALTTQRDAPAQLGSPAASVHDALRGAGFTVGDVGVTDERSPQTTVRYRHHASGASAEIGYRDGRVATIHHWLPGTTKPASDAPLISGRAPNSYDEFVSDMTNQMRRIAADYGQALNLNGFVIKDSESDHMAVHGWDGRVYLGRDIRPDMNTLGRTAGRRDLTDGEARGVYASVVTTAHEGLHGVNPISQPDYTEGEHRALEEALTEEWAHMLAADVLRRYGRTDVLEWAKAHPHDSKVQGSYSYYRSALRGLLDEAGVPPESRVGLVEQLKFRTPPTARPDALAALLPNQEGHWNPRERVRLVLSNADWHTENKTRTGMFDPIIRPDLSDIADRAPLEHDGQSLTPGRGVMVRQHDGSVLPGAIIDVQGATVGSVPADTRFVAQVQYPNGKVDRYVTPSMIESVGGMPKGAEQDKPPDVRAPYPKDMSAWDRWGAQLVPISALLPLRDAVETTTPAKVKELRAQISKDGMVEPITIDHALSDGRTYISEGNNRLEAAHAEGFTHVPVRVITVTKVRERHGGQLLPPHEHAPQYARPTDIGLPTYGTPEVLLADSKSRRGGYIEKPGTYLRFGDLPLGDDGTPVASMNHLAGRREPGVSVYSAWKDPATGKYVLPSGSEQYLATQNEISERPIFEVTGRDTGERGDDGEPLLHPESVRVQGRVFPEEVVNEQDPWLTVKGTELKPEETPDWHDVGRAITDGEATKRLDSLFDAWSKSRSEEQVEAFMVYQSPEGFQAINGALREGGSAPDERRFVFNRKIWRDTEVIDVEHIDRSVSEWAALLDRAIADAPPTDVSLRMFVHRGVRDSGAVFGPDGPHVGQRVIDRAFVSTSPDVETARTFAENDDAPWLDGSKAPGRALIQIEVPPEAHAGWMTGAMSLDIAGSEFLLPRGSEFEVTGVRSDGDLPVVEMGMRTEGGSFVDPNSIPIPTKFGPVTFVSGGDAVGSEYHAYYVAKLADGTPVGHVNVAYLGDEAAIQNIEVPEQYRRGGVGSALIQRIRNEDPARPYKISTLGGVRTPEGDAFVASGRKSHWNEPPLYHGTNAELAPGDLVVPNVQMDMPHTESPHYSPEHVYVTTGDHLAERYAVARAGRHGGAPHVYQIESVGAVSPDPEFAASGFGSDQKIVPMARVVREVPLPGLSHWDAETGSLKRGSAPVKEARVHGEFPNAGFAKPEHATCSYCGEKATHFVMSDKAEAKLACSAHVERAKQGNPAAEVQKIDPGKFLHNTATVAKQHLNEGEFDEGLHPRDRLGKWAKKAAGSTSVHPHFFETVGARGVYRMEKSGKVWAVSRNGKRVGLARKMGNAKELALEHDNGSWHRSRTELLAGVVDGTHHPHEVWGGDPAWMSASEYARARQKLIAMHASMPVDSLREQTLRMSLGEIITRATQERQKDPDRSFHDDPPMESDRKPSSLLSLDGPYPSYVVVTAYGEGRHGSVNLSPEVRQSVEAALEAIDATHSIPAEHPVEERIPVAQWDDGRPFVQADYRSYRDAAVIVPIAVRMSPHGDSREASFTHEYGHVLDQQIIGGGRFYGSEAGMVQGDHPLHPVMRALYDTPEAAAINRLRTDNRLVAVNGELRPVSEFKDKLDYLLTPKEMFARAYAQWVGLRSVNATIRSQIAVGAGPTLLAPTQWTEEHFAPVADAFDKAFEALGLGKE